MATEYVILMALFALVLAGVIFGDSGPIATFADSAPRLAARLEKNIATGTAWSSAGGNGIGGWLKPTGAPPRTN